MLAFNDLTPYVGYVVNDTLHAGLVDSDFHLKVNDRSVLVVYQCGFETMVVAVNSYLGISVDDKEAEDLAADYLSEIDWFNADGTREADRIVRK